MFEEKETKRIIGLMSGTSCDSIDAGLCEVNPDMSVKLIKGINFPYPEHIRAKLFAAFRGEVSIKEICQLNFAVGKCFADAANTLIQEFGKVDLISSHGQTIYHYPFDTKLDNVSLNFLHTISLQALSINVFGYTNFPLSGTKIVLNHNLNISSLPNECICSN